MQHSMWNRRGTYSAAVSDMLASTRVLRVGSKSLVITPPTRTSVQRAASIVSNLATALCSGLKAEFPNFAMQSLFSCLQLKTNEHSANDLRDLRALLRLMKQSQSSEDSCVAEFVQGRRHAMSWINREGRLHHKSHDASKWS